MRKTFSSYVTVLVLLALSVGACSSPKAARPRVDIDGTVQSQSLSRFMPVLGAKGMVVADDREAAEWGAEILRKGGNAVDAAVATAFAMAVTRPHFASLGGGGFLLYCPAPKGQGATAPDCTVIDYREVAPAGVKPEMFIQQGTLREDLLRNGAMASGVPGVPAGLLLALEKFGKMKRAVVLSRPIEMARKGIRLSTYTEFALHDRWSRMNPAGKAIFGCAPGAKDKRAELKPCVAGTLLKQTELARVLEEIARKGQAGFYDGWVGDRIAQGHLRAGGVLNKQDLLKYRPVIRKPLTGSFHGMQVVSLPPPSAGGATLLQMLGYVELAEKQGLLENGYGSGESIHVLAHAMGLAFADRAQYFGDPDSVTIPLAGLLAPQYLKGRWESTFSAGKLSLPVKAGVVAIPEKNHTTHFSVVDREGNAVALTTTVNDNLGSAFVPEGTGVVMNNELDDFAVIPEAPNLYGLVGSQANALAPGKKPISSMTATIVRDAGGMPRIVLGAAGGPRITTSVFQTLVNRLAFGIALPDSVALPRAHEQWEPKTLKLERFGFSAETRSLLLKKGYALEEVSSLGRMHALERFPDGRVWGVPDRRAEGGAAAE